MVDGDNGGDDVVRLAEERVAALLGLGQRAQGGHHRRPIVARSEGGVRQHHAHLHLSGKRTIKA